MSQERGASERGTVDVDRSGLRPALHGRCPECATALPNPWTDRCRHRRACEARQMMQASVDPADAARHAQRLGP